MTENHLQRTEAWFKEREGKLTASAFGQAAGLGPSSRQALWRRLMGLDVFEGNDATAWGTDNEPYALKCYTKFNALPDGSHSVSLSGFVKHPTMDWIGGSPDFLVGDEGMGEIKCPFNQKQYDGIPTYYMAQMQGLMEICNRAWCDFVVWTPTSTTMCRVFRSKEYWQWLELRLADFWIWVQAQVEPPREKKVPVPEDIEITVSTKIEIPSSLYPIR